MNKFKKFISEKRDVVLFIGILIITFATVITIATLASRNNKPVSSIPDTPSDTPDNPDNPNTTPDNPDDSQTFKFSLPLNGEYIITREFFDLNNEETMTSAVITNGLKFSESHGLSFAKSDNSEFEVLAIYPGTVIEVIGDSESLDGYTVVLSHEDGFKSTYKSLKSVSVKVGDNLKLGDVIGVSGTSVSDPSANVHVHLEIQYNNSYVNPKSVFGYEASELAETVK